MNATEICDALEGAGVAIDTTGGKPRLVGGEQTPELIAAVKAEREGVLAEWRRREEEPRYRRVPRVALPLRAKLLACPGSAGPTATAAGLVRRRLAFEHGLEQGAEVQQWLEHRAMLYELRVAPASGTSCGLTDGERQACEFTALMDLLAWQCRCDWAGALEKIEGMCGALAA